MLADRPRVIPDEALKAGHVCIITFYCPEMTGPFEYELEVKQLVKAVVAEANLDSRRGKTYFDYAKMPHYEVCVGELPPGAFCATVFHDGAPFCTQMGTIPSLMKADQAIEKLEQRSVLSVLKQVMGQPARSNTLR